MRDAKIFCDETVKNQIDLISEVETCIYEINIISSLVCGIPNFSKKSNDFGIKCNPVIDGDEYEKYAKKKQELSVQASLLKARLRYEQMQQQKEKEKSKEKQPPAQNEPKQMTSENPKEDTTAKAMSDLDVHKLNIESMQNEISSKLHKSEQTFTDLSENAHKFKTILTQVEMNKLNGDNEQNKNYLTEAQKILTKQVDDFLKTDEVFDKLTNQLNDLIDDLNFDDENDEAKEAHTDYLSKFEETSEKEIKKLMDDDSTTETKQEDTVLEEIVTQTESPPTAEDRIKTLESRIVESLSKSNKYADKFKNGDIKIKIITLNSDANELEESDELKYLLSG